LKKRLSVSIQSDNNNNQLPFKQAPLLTDPKKLGLRMEIASYIIQEETRKNNHAELGCTAA
jgi:hypothetical protein